MNDDPCYTGVNISKWLSQEKLSRIKRLRQQCHDLNVAYSASNKGLKPYVVISDKIMNRNSYGKLQLFISDVNDVGAAKPVSETSVNKTQKTDVLASNNELSQKELSQMSIESNGTASAHISLNGCVTRSNTNSKNVKVGSRVASLSHLPGRLMMCMPTGEQEF